MADTNNRFKLLADIIGAFLLWSLGGEQMSFSRHIEPPSVAWVVLFSSTFIAPALFLVARNSDRLKRQLPVLHAYWPALGIGCASTILVIVVGDALN